MASLPSNTVTSTTSTVSMWCGCSAFPWVTLIVPAQVDVGWVGEAGPGSAFRPHEVLLCRLTEVRTLHHASLIAMFCRYGAMWTGDNKAEVCAHSQSDAELLAVESSWR